MSVGILRRPAPSVGFPEFIQALIVVAMVIA
ncbi:hypothetical protein ACVWY0_003383 [Arthrobacter sp. UYNi723]